MTENHEDSDTTEQAAEDAQQTDQAESVATPDKRAQDASRGNAEAAKYRRQLRDTEAERDTLRGRVESLQRAEAERLAAVDGVKPSALWAAGATLDGLLDDDGNVDPDKVSTAAHEAADRLGIRRDPGPGYVPAEGTLPDVSKLHPRGFAEAFTPPGR